MNHDALKTEIKTAAAETTTQRREATRLYIKGRKLRHEGRALGDTPDIERGEDLLKEGWNLHNQAADLIYETESTRYDRRHLHLAAAMLNGRTYLQCEPKTNPQKTGSANDRAIGYHIQEFLPEGDNADAQALAFAKEWVKNGNVRIRFDREANRVAIVPVEPVTCEAEAA